jgi:putative DNA primase/helicase
MPPVKDYRAEAKRTAQRAQEALGKALAIWNGALPVALDDPAGRYLTRRGLAAAISSPALRYRSDCQHWNPRGRYPALICRVDDVKGTFIGLQRIFLKRDGRKSNVEPAKACKGPIWGGAIRIGGNAPEIVIAEGPETAIAAGVIMNLPAWSAISAGNLSKGVILPQEIVSIVIAADNDPSGVQAAESAATRWQREGRKVRIIKPNLAGQDFNDVLMTQTANGGTA